MIDVHTELHYAVQFEVQLAPQVVVGFLDIIKSYVRFANFITPLFHDLDAVGKRKIECQFSAQRARKEEVAVIHH